MVYAYFIIGIILMSFSGSRIIKRHGETAYKDPMFWLTTIVMVICWPIVMVEVIIKLLKD